MPQAPDDLKGAASEFWDQQAPKLHQNGVLTELDTKLFRLLCEAWGRYCDAVDRLEKDGATFKAESGYQQSSVAWTQVKQSEERFLKLAREFKMSPAARPRVKPSKVKLESDNPFSKI